MHVTATAGGGCATYALTFTFPPKLSRTPRGWERLCCLCFGRMIATCVWGMMKCWTGCRIAPCRVCRRSMDPLCLKTSSAPPCLKTWATLPALDRHGPPYIGLTWGTPHWIDMGSPIRDMGCSFLDRSVDAVADEGEGLCGLVAYYAATPSGEGFYCFQ